MRRPIFRLFLLSSLFLTNHARADFDAQHWKFRVPVQAAQSAVSEFAITPEIYSHSSHQLTDLRLLRKSVQVPFELETLAGSLSLNEQPARMINKSWRKGVGVRTVLDLGSRREHNRISIGTSLENFKETVRVETSDDGRDWSTALVNAVIFDISRPELHASHLTVSYPASNRRYLRLTMPGWQDPAALDSVSVSEYAEKDSVRDERSGLRPATAQHAHEQTTDFVFDLDFEGLPVDRLTFEVDSAGFSRLITVLTSSDQKLWRGIGSGNIYRTGSEKSLTVDLTESWSRYLKVTVMNGDSAPIVMSAATASWLRRIMRFPSKETGSYELYLGNAEARTPVYDFGKVDDPKIMATVASVGRVEANAEFRGAQAPYSERNPLLLNGALVVAVAAMSFVTYRFAKRTRSEANENS